MTAKDKGKDVLKNYYAGINAMPAPKSLGPERANAERLRSVAEKLADALRAVIYSNALEECDCLAGVEVLKEWNALREGAEGGGA